MAFYFHTSRVLTSEKRGLLIRKLSERIGHKASHKPADWTIDEGYLTVRLWDFVIREWREDSASHLYFI